MRIVYIIGRILTFPGAYLRGFWEHLTCRLFSIPVESEGYLRLDEACGHIEHDFPATRGRAYIIAVGPGFMNFFIGLPLFLSSLMGLYSLGITVGDSKPLFIMYLVFADVGVSLLCNCFPLAEDALHLWDVIYGRSKANILVRIIMFIPTVRTVIGAYIEKYSLSVLFYIAFCVAMALTV